MLFIILFSEKTGFNVARASLSSITDNFWPSSLNIFTRGEFKTGHCPLAKLVGSSPLNAK